MAYPVILAWSVMSPLFGCINTSYSRTDEVEITNNLAHLIVGAFAHHGPAFYKKEVERCLALLKKDPNNFDARNDLGAAYTKLGEFEKAQAAFEANEKRHPGRYKTASNLGVMFKKKGDYAKAAEWIARALKIKPGGHMGLGDYYLRMIRWREKADKFKKSDTDKMQENFLGVRYDAGTAATAAEANRDYVITLIKNDVDFADAYVVLGDILFEERDFQLALRAYFRARVLAQSPWDVISGRENAIIKKWRAEKKEGYVLEDRWGRQLEREIAGADHWLKTYQKVEAQRLSEGKPVGFAEMKVAISQAGQQKPRILEAVYYRGVEVGGMGGPDPAIVGTIIAVACIALLGSVGLLVVVIRRRASTLKPDLKPKF